MNSLPLQLLTQLVKRFEGCRLQAYLCPAGIPTIGYGATGPDIHLGLTWDQATAEARLDLDANRFLLGTLKLCPMARNRSLAGLSDFAYNLGLTRLKQSTLRRKFNCGDLAGAVAELLKWNRAGGKVLRGLTIRRLADAALLTAPDPP